MPSTKTQRWLDLLSFLLGRRVPVPVEEIMERVPAYAAKWRDGSETDRATARRTFERDKDDLRSLGVPLEPVEYSIGGGLEKYEGYRVAHRDFYLPYLRLIAEEEDAEPPRPYRGLPSLELTAAEAELALEALRRSSEAPAFPFASEAASALRKIAFDLDLALFPEDPVIWVERPGTREMLAHLRILSAALLARKRVRFTYHGIHRGRATERDVGPYGLFFQRDWYLVGQDADANAIRIFRVSRMEGVTQNTRAPKRPDYEVPDDFSLRNHLDRRAWELGDDDAISVEVLFDFPLSIRMDRTREGEWVRDEPGGAAIRRFRVSRPDPFLRWILSLAGDAQILEPLELRDELRAMAERIGALYPDQAVVDV